MNGTLARRAIVGLLAVAVLAPVSAAGQPGGPEPAPRLPWGAPDLHGVWDFRTITPLERPADLAGKSVLTSEKAANYEALENRRQNRDLVDPAKGGALYPPESEGGVVPYNEYWYDRGSSLHGIDSHATVGAADLRIRLSRGELRHA